MYVILLPLIFISHVSFKCSVRNDFEESIPTTNTFIWESFSLSFSLWLTDSESLVCIQMTWIALLATSSSGGKLLLSFLTPTINFLNGRNWSLSLWHLFFFGLCFFIHKVRGVCSSKAGTTLDIDSDMDAPCILLISNNLTVRNIVL